MDEWKKIWISKGQVDGDSFTLEQLIGLDGFDTGAGQFPVQAWLANVDMVKTRLGIKPGASILEVGCGTGAFLFPFADKGYKLSGVDYSANLVAIAQKAIPEGTFVTNEAANLEFEDNQFDYVIVNSVFQYFADLDYAEKAMEQISQVLKRPGKVAILDLNDAAKKQEYENIRRQKLGDEEYERLYSSLTHMFYDRNWVAETARKFGFACEIEQVDIDGYSNSSFRYNVFLESLSG